MGGQEYGAVRAGQPISGPSLLAPSNHRLLLAFAGLVLLGLLDILLLSVVAFGHLSHLHLSKGVYEFSHILGHCLVAFILNRLRHRTGDAVHHLPQVEPVPLTSNLMVPSARCKAFSAALPMLSQTAGPL